jgi:hypothetical protein
MSRQRGSDGWNRYNRWRSRCAPRENFPIEEKPGVHDDARQAKEKI